MVPIEVQTDVNNEPTQSQPTPSASSHEASVTAKDVTLALISTLLGFRPPFTPDQILAIESLKKPYVKSTECSFCLRLEKSNPLGRFDRFLTCCDCGSSGHPHCLKYSPSLTQYLQEKNVKWQCYECKKCSVCLQTCDSLLLCDKCDRGYHKECCRPPLTKRPKGDFICQICKELTLALDKEQQVVPNLNGTKKKRRLSTMSSSKAASIENSNDDSKSNLEKNVVEDEKDSSCSVDTSKKEKSCKKIGNNLTNFFI
jgi:hypothetical protein